MTELEKLKAAVDDAWAVARDLAHDAAWAAAHDARDTEEAADAAWTAARDAAWTATRAVAREAAYYAELNKQKENFND